MKQVRSPVVTSTGTSPCSGCGSSLKCVSNVVSSCAQSGLVPYCVCHRMSKGTNISCKVTCEMGNAEFLNVYSNSDITTRESCPLNSRGFSLELGFRTCTHVET
ncbi:hypothetical protein M758_2G037300 [Ceratodon purpureus]|nr:hypothetical protein M758_2G037300 [Ceratodon purpureus]